jgi:hypothetical protein
MSRSFSHEPPGKNRAAFAIYAFSEPRHVKKPCSARLLQRFQNSHVWLSIVTSNNFGCDIFICRRDAMAADHFASPESTLSLNFHLKMV